MKYRIIALIPERGDWGIGKIVSDSMLRRDGFDPDALAASKTIAPVIEKPAPGKQAKPAE